MVAAHLPLEMIEEILLNLPVKSLLRFSSVSKLWNSMIFEQRFTRKYKRSARLVVYMNPDAKVSSLHALSSISSNPPIDIEIDLSIEDEYIDDIDCICTGYSGQFDRVKPYLCAFCDKLWLVKHGESLFLWNPSMRGKAKLPSPFFEECEYHPKFIYGLGYDCVGDDYKILKIRRSRIDQAELYSLKDNSWRKVESSSPSVIPPWNQKRCQFVDGIFHWIGLNSTGNSIIVSFNLSTEKYGEMALPHVSSNCVNLDVAVAVVRGMLTVNYLAEPNFEVWVMEEYEVEKSWTKKFYILYGDCLWFQPLYFYDNNDILIQACDQTSNKMEIILYKNDKDARPTQIVHSSYVCYGIYLNGEAFFYVESLISPKPKPPRVNNE